MKILSIFWSESANVSLLDHGKLVAAVSEERFTGEKNDSSFPRASLDWMVKEFGLNDDTLEAVAIASHATSADYVILSKPAWSVQDYLKEQKEYWFPKIYLGKNQDRIFDVLHDKINLNQFPKDYWSKKYKERDFSTFDKDKSMIIFDYLRIDSKKIHYIDHHRCHAAYSYYASQVRGEKVLAFTADSWGDGLNATVGLFNEDGSYERFYGSAECNIGRIYRFITLLLGMKPNEHEYKVMGLAPYCKQPYGERALRVFEDTLSVEGLTFVWKQKPKDSYEWFKERLEGIRFDAIAWGLQTWVENLLTKWVRNSIEKFDVHKILFSGGVAMNVKAMGKIAQLPEVEDLFVGGTPGDHTLSAGAAFCLYEDLMKKAGKQYSSSELVGITDLYLGPALNSVDEDQAVDTLDRDEYRVILHPTADFMARLLVEGKVLARCCGRMEYGQRSLGNRSILADPSHLRIKEKINHAIKNRDFWMPFAPVVLDRYVDRYLVNPNQIESKYMTLSYETTAEGYESMIAAAHPADRTVRPQFLSQVMNPKFYELLSAFEKLTKRGALLNTSFNLHGYPIVNTADQAIQVLRDSELDGLILENYLVLKNIRMSL